MASIKTKTPPHIWIATATIAMTLLAAPSSPGQEDGEAKTPDDAMRDVARNAAARRQNPILQPQRAPERAPDRSSENGSPAAQTQDDTPTAANPPVESSTQQSGDIDEAGSDAVPTVTYRTPLLREGSFLTEASGRLIFDEAIGFWVFEAEPDYVPTTVSHRISPRFIMLPCTKLNQMQRTIESTSFETIFLVTGRITAFEDHNYLIPLDAPLVEQRARVATDGRPEPPAADQMPADETDALIESIRREVPVARSLAAFEDAVEGSADDLKSLAPEGTLIVARRGRIARTARGGWEFIFTADADGLADAPMTLLPCLLLEHMQRTVDRRHTIDSMLLTGEVFTYRGRNFLLPTTYQMERFTGNVGR